MENLGGNRADCMHRRPRLYELGLVEADSSDQPTLEELATSLSAEEVAA